MTERTKTLVWKKTQAQRDRFTRSMGREWKAALMEQIKPLLQEVSVATLDGLVARVPQLIQEDLIKEQLDRNVSLVGGYFAKATFNSIQKSGAPMLILKEAIPTDDQWKEFVSGKLGQRAGVRVTSITGSSRDQAVKIIQSTLQEGALEGMGTSQVSVLLRDNLNSQWGQISTYRAARIARTETTMASNLGSLVGAEQTGEPMMKVWLSTRDSRTRRKRGKQRYDHYGKAPTGPDGETQELDHPFKKTGESLAYPGEYGGSAGNVIHCRCTMFYEPKEVDEIPDPTPTPGKPIPRKPVVPRPAAPAKPKPTGSRAEIMASTKKKLQDLESDPDYKKLSQATADKKRIGPTLNPMADEINGMRRNYTPGISDAERAIEIEAFYNLRQSKVAAWKKAKAQYNKALRDIVKYEARLGPRIAEIMAATEEANLAYEVVSLASKGVPEAINTGAKIFERIMGKIDDGKWAEIRTVYQSKRKRAYSSRSGAFVFIGDGAGAAAHEMAHAAEYVSKTIQKATRELFIKRCTGDVLKKYHGEVAWWDKFPTPYSGRSYFGGRWNPLPEGTVFDVKYIPQEMGGEIFSMWWTELLADPILFMQTDLEYFEWGYNLILKLQGIT